MRIFDHINTEVDAEGKHAAAVGLCKLFGNLLQRLLTILALREQHGKLVAAQAPAKAPCLLGNLPQHVGRFDKHLVAPEDAEECVDQAEVHDVACNHHPGHLGSAFHHFSGELIKGVGIEHVRQAVVVRKIVDSPCADVLLLPVIGCGIAIGPDIHKLHDRVIGAPVPQLQLYRIGLDKVILILKMLGLLLMAAGPTCQGAGAVDAFLLRVPDPVAALVHRDLSVLTEIQDSAFDRVHHAGKFIFPGHLP